ncbi:MAG: hypothetical protein LC791_08615 [Acidobacteria bacterium]|nr:hypothetical protein [Acidobacteriota bacterium]
MQVSFYRWTAFGGAALLALLLATPADAQWRDGGARRRAPSGYGNYSNPAYSQGFADGYDKGRDDAEDRDRYDVRRHGRYRSADHGYERRYGSKEQYKRFYRDGFAAGYDQAYREEGRYNRGRGGRGNQGPWGRGGRGPWWP